MKTRNLIAFVLLFVILNVFAQDIRRAIPGQIETYIDRFDENKVDRNKNGWAHYYIPKGMGDTLTVKMSCVYEGTQTHAPHTHHEDEAFYIVKGPVNFHINGEERVLNTGDFVYTPSGSLHNIQRVNEEDTIKYLVIKRETIKDVDKPHPVGKENYTMEDCYSYPANNSDWSRGEEAASRMLLDKTFADGFQIVMERVTDHNKVFQRQETEEQGQVAVYILSGEADVTLDGQQAQINADNTFYCPRQSVYSLRKTGAEPLMFLLITTE